jgi:hypothetical protein
LKGTCRFVGEEREFADDSRHRKIRALEITFEDGFVGVIYVTKGEEFEVNRFARAWHYEINQDGTRITLENFKHASSVDFLDSIHHEVIENWPLLP